MSAAADRMALREFEARRLWAAGEVPKEDRVWYECRSCGGVGDHGCDEEGKVYSCYACGERGGYWGPASHRAELNWRDYLAIEADVIRAAEESKRREALGVPPGWSYYYDEYDGEVVLVPPRGAAPVAKVADDGFDDIPF